MKVYKYRGASDLDRDLEALASDYFFAPDAANLNDAMEALLSDALAVRATKAMGRTVSDSYQQLVGMRRSVGIYSLSRVPDNEVMWAQYGESHEGFCIEYDLDRLVLEARDQWSVVDVVYSESPPTLAVADLVTKSGCAGVIRKLVGHKSQRWAYEDELRIITTRSGRNNYAQAAVTGIYFGCRCSEGNIKKVRRRLSGRAHTYSVMRFTENSYTLGEAYLARDDDIDGTPPNYHAPLDELAIPDPEALGVYSNRLDEVERAVETVRQDPSCKRVLLADVSVSGPRKGRIFVQYQTAVQTDLSDTVNRYFDLKDLCA